MKNTLEFDKPDFNGLLDIFGDYFKRKPNDGQLAVPAQFGKGFIWAETLPCGMSVMVSDFVLTNELEIIRNEIDEQFFLLQFCEIFPDESQSKIPKSKYHQDEVHSSVKLTHTLVSETFSMPAGFIYRSVKFFFRKSNLVTLWGKDAIEEMMGKHFPLQVTSEKQDPISSEFKIMLDDLLVEMIDHPLRLNFIQNRILMMLEKYIIKIHNNQTGSYKKVKRTDDETTRLVNVEILLVKNFAVSPPTIDELSRISAMSPTKLKNDFKALYGMPIYEYYQKHRMAKAKSLLLLGKYSIKEVGIKVGYSNLSHFANTFKKEFGFLPSEMASKDGMVVYN